MAEWSKATASKAVIPGDWDRGFESRSLLVLVGIFVKRSAMENSAVDSGSQAGMTRKNQTQKKDQLCAIVPKLWGREEWIVNGEKYCGKKLIFMQGYRFSLHYHKIKEESFYVLSGSVFLELVDQGVRSERILTPGDVVHVKPYVQHRITALTEAELFEFSTHHMDDDSYRLEESCKVDLSTLILPL